MDDTTSDYIKDNCNYFISHVDELVVYKFSTSEYDLKAKSRFLKTTMRYLVKGDFLYIDCDTIICKKIPAVLPGLDIAAVPDNHCSVTDKIYEFAPVIQRAKDSGYSVGYNSLHFNGGVLYCSDSDRVYDFFDLWHRLWNDNYRNGIYIDQLSLNEANYRMQGVITELDGVWNCMLRYGIKYLSEAIIIHYFASNRKFEPSNYGFFFENTNVYETIRKHKSLTNEIEEALAQPKRMFKMAYIIEVGTCRYHILNSEAYKFLEYLFFKHRGLYKLSESLCYNLRKLSHLGKRK